MVTVAPGASCPGAGSGWLGLYSTSPNGSGLVLLHALSAAERTGPSPRLGRSGELAGAAGTEPGGGAGQDPCALCLSHTFLDVPGERAGPGLTGLTGVKSCPDSHTAPDKIQRFGLIFGL